MSKSDDKSNEDFLRNRGGVKFTSTNNNNSGFSNRGNRGERGRGRGRGRNNFYNNRDNNRDGDNPNFRRPNDDNNNNYFDRRGGRDRGYRGGRGGNRRPYNDNNNNYSHRDEGYNYRGNRDRGRGRGYNSERNYRNDYNNYYNYNDNFNRNYYQYQNDELNAEYEKEKELQLEKEKYNNDFKKKYEKIITALKSLFIHESLNEENIIQIIKDIKANPNMTIFEVMNEIYRKVQIIKTLALNKNQRIYGPNKDIIVFDNEQKLNKGDLIEVIQEYKIYKKNEIEDDDEKKDKSWYYVDEFDKRRKLLKDDDGMFNYLPIKNPEGNININNDDDIYAKNDNEILYHALFYKTIMCKECNISNNNNNEINIKDNDISNSHLLLCPYAHNILKDFRIIYKNTDEEVLKFMLLLQNSSLFNFQNYLNYIPMSLQAQFNIDTFKVHRCQLDKDCPNDYHLCPYYHKSIKEDKQRRPLLLFDYSGNTCEYCFNIKKKSYSNDKNCPLGIFCKNIHNKNEFNYHPEHFRKEFKCTRDKDKNGKCIYIKTCYGKHSEEEEEEKNNINEEEEEESIDLEEIEKDEKVAEIIANVKKSLMIAKKLRCRKCQNVDKGKICYFKDCKHFLCFNCYKKIYKENKKNIKEENKESKNNNNDNDNKLFCPFCGKEIIKKSVIGIEFKESKK